MAAPACVFLVPGFFGFTSLKKLNYFHGVKRALEASLARRGVDARVIPCRTKPTASIRRRAEALLDEVLLQAGDADAAFHFVGHSTGGVDIRVLLSPGAHLESPESEAVARRTRTAVLVATPNRGSPLASAFLTLHGKRLLQVLALLATSNEGRHTLSVGAVGLGLLARLDAALGRRPTALDQMADLVLHRLTPSKDDPVWRFLREVAVDQGAVVQLLPEAMDLLDAVLVDRPGVAYHCVVTAAPPPPYAYRLRELATAQGLVLSALFTLLWRLTARENRAYPYPRPRGVLADLASRLGMAVDGTTSDGVVPTLSQLHGNLLEAVVADHLDVVGQFRMEGGNPFSDWLPSASRLDQDAFDRVWDRVAGAIAGEAATRAQPFPGAVSASIRRPK
jgi:hypothetical protein